MSFVVIAVLCAGRQRLTPRQTPPFPRHHEGCPKVLLVPTRRACAGALNHPMVPPPTPPTNPAVVLAPLIAQDDRMQPAQAATTHPPSTPLWRAWVATAQTFLSSKFAANLFFFQRWGLSAGQGGRFPRCTFLMTFSASGLGASFREPLEKHRRQQRQHRHSR
jgi:hypothetical protein